MRIQVRALGMSRSEVAASYRLYAAYCREMAQRLLEPGRKLTLLGLAQAWTRLADRAEQGTAGDEPAFDERLAALRRGGPNSD